MQLNSTEGMLVEYDTNTGNLIDPTTYKVVAHTGGEAHARAFAREKGWVIIGEDTSGRAGR
jgi:hypothetical protein